HISSHRYVAPTYLLLPFFFSPPPAHRALHPFPTRRSSDLRGAGTRIAGRLGLAQRPPAFDDRDQRPPHVDQARHDGRRTGNARRSEEHTSELQSPYDLVCRLLLEKKNQDPLPPVQHLTTSD